jgi:HKD family nuclease
MKLKWKRLFYLLFTTPVGCTFLTVENQTVRAPSAVSQKSFLEAVPASAVNSSLQNSYEKRRKQVFRKIHTDVLLAADQAQLISRYLDFLKLPDSEKPAVQARLFESNLNFLNCADLEDWSCLQAPPKTLPLALHRVESRAGLGNAVEVKAALDVDYYFTEQWYRNRKNLTDENVVKIADRAQIAGELQKVINNNWSRVSMAIYGIDGLGEIDSKTKLPNNSMQDIFSAISSQPSVRAVVDVEAYSKNGIVYQYPPTTSLIEQLNKNPNEPRLRLENPAANIMHNKFFVFEDREKKSVWTGTANISKNCMGDEDFSNMSVYVKNTPVAAAFLQEFEEMFAGAFHRNKRPDTHRYFKFADGAEVTVHFSPTDDGEHRAILPLLLSARPGDQIRVSMFGSAGAEYVRALQYAAFRGADVKVFVDRDTSFQISNSWINRKAKVRLQEVNPYGKPAGRLEIRHTDWGAGNMNHHKSATLTRKTAKGWLPQVLVVGSQNWSLAGNDENDENMLVLRNLKNGLDVVKSYNRHFDSMIWPTGKIVPQE